MCRFNIDFVSCSKEKIMKNNKKNPFKLRKRQRQFEKKLEGNRKQSNELSKNQIRNKNPTESLLRYAMQKAKINYEYQKPYYNIDRYVCVDFYLPDLNIVVELDGFSHKGREDYDIERTMYLKRRHNVKRVVRFTNHEAMYEMDKIIDYLLNTK